MSQLISYYSLVSYTVGIVGETYTITFPYINKSDITLFINGDEYPDTDITWTSDSTVTVANTSVGDEVYFRRYTRRDARWVDFSNAGIVGEDDLNTVTLQLLYLIQEMWDSALTPDDGTAPPGSGGEPGQGGGSLPSLIDDIIAELLQTQLFQDLVTLIELTDINAANAIQNALDIHATWSQTQLIDAVVDNHTINLSDIGVNLASVDAQIIEIQNTEIANNATTATLILGVASRLDDAEANVITLQTTVTDLDSATATSISQLQSSIDANEALILTVEQTLTTADDALASRIDVLEVDFAGDVSTLSARVGTIESAYVDATEANAIALTQIDTRFQNNDWEDLFNSSSYINGINANSQANESTIAGLESFLVGVGGDINDPQSWQPGSQAQALAGLQTTVDAQASTLFANSDFRTSMFAQFNPPELPDNTFPNIMIGSMVQQWQVYADSESAVVSRVDSLEVNSQPIFFRSVAPDPRAAEFDNTPYSGGFPEGSMWHNDINPTYLVSYYWHGTNTLPTGIDFGQTVQFEGITGMWVQFIDGVTSTQGASINTLFTVYNDLNTVGGVIDQRISAVVGDDISTIEETLESYIETDTGLSYASWNVRINQYNNGIPVIAGVGLGMQNDINNPEASSRSDFIVMADYFSVVKPPVVNPLTGEWDPSTTTVPFIVDTDPADGQAAVVVSGDMFVRNTLSANDGFAGRFTFTDLDGNGYPVVRDGNYNATGARLVLASDTNNYNLGTGGSNFPGGESQFKVLMWAGTGQMSHNNAVFYIDTDGNAFFGGSVSAANIEGAVGNATVVSHEGSVITVPNGSTAWHQVGGDVVSNTPSVPRDRRGSATVSVAVFGNGANAARVRLSMSKESSLNSNAWGSWFAVSEYPIGIDIGTALTLSGTHPEEGTGRFKIKVEIAREQANNGTWQYPQSNKFDGTIILSS